jgi:hypothetical protein
VRQWAASLTQLTASLPRIGTDEISELEQAVTLFRRWDASGAGGLRRKAVAGQLNAVAESLRDDHPREITMRLFQVTAELAQLAGWMAYDQGLSGAAQRYYLLALHACRDSMSPGLGAKVIGDMTQLSTALGNYDDSLTLTHTALYSLPRFVGQCARRRHQHLRARLRAAVRRDRSARPAAVEAAPCRSRAAMGTAPDQRARNPVGALNRCSTHWNEIGVLRCGQIWRPQAASLGGD